MAKKKILQGKEPKKKRVKSVTVAEQNPAAVDVQATAEALVKRKQKKR